MALQQEGQGFQECSATRGTSVHFALPGASMRAAATHVEVIHAGREGPYGNAQIPAGTCQDAPVPNCTDSAVVNRIPYDLESDDRTAASSRYWTWEFMRFGLWTTVHAVRRAVPHHRPGEDRQPN